MYGKPWTLYGIILIYHLRSLWDPWQSSIVVSLAQIIGFRENRPTMIGLLLWERKFRVTLSAAVVVNQNLFGNYTIILDKKIKINEVTSYSPSDFTVNIKVCCWASTELSVYYCQFWLIKEKACWIWVFEGESTQKGLVIIRVVYMQSLGNNMHYSMHCPRWMSKQWCSLGLSSVIASLWGEAQNYGFA